jgi:SAM-dependent methyltransferase
MKVCPICKKKNAFLFRAQKDYRLAKCAECEMVWDPSPGDARSFYEKNYFINDNPKGGYANYFEGMKINKKTFSKRLNQIEKRLGFKGMLLDVGCALGDCLEEAKILGWQDIFGLEISSYASSFAQKRGLPVKNGILSDKLFAENFFDVVAYQDVIEHISDPLNELKLAHKALKPGGYIFLVTPDIGGYWARILGSLWYHFKPGEHIMYFSKRSLEIALKEAGFAGIEIRITYHVLSLEYILNRLRYYWPWFFKLMLKIVGKLKIKDKAFRAYTGELEAWARRY